MKGRNYEMKDGAIVEVGEPFKIALADAVRRPMGIVPDSAYGMLSHDDLMDAETRRVSDVTAPCDHCGFPTLTENGVPLCWVCHRIICASCSGHNCSRVTPKGTPR